MKMKILRILIFGAASVALIAAEGTRVSTVNVARPTARGSLYIGNREPLVPSSFVKLPIGSISPKGWLRHQLELEAAGMIGRLAEISKWCKFEGNAWVSPEGQGHSAWEELPYWLKGYGDLGYVLGDQKIMMEARRWIDGVLSSQAEDGYFGPRANKTGLQGKPDLWPHMVMLNVLQSFYEFSHDSRVLPFMTRYCQWLNQQPPETFARGYWPKIRWGDNVETAYWLYNRTGDRWLLDLAKKIHDNMQDWTSGVHNWHNVNIAQAFREPSIFWQQTPEEKFRHGAEQNYQQVMDAYGQFPGGGFAGDENCRPGFTDSRQGFETCGMVEFMHSFEMLTKILGEPIWSDRTEEIAFNSLPAAVTPDWKGLHYLTSANMVQLDRQNKAPGIQNGGTMFSYSPFEVYRCCQHNVSHGWPYYAEELWLASADGGICASLYAPSEVVAKTSGGTVRVKEETAYPFEETIRFTFTVGQPAAFPFYFRIPGWSGKPEVRLNGKLLNFEGAALSYGILNRTWKNNDRVTVRLPMEVNVRRWEKNQNAASVHYGPLGFSLKIGEKWARYGTNESWPEWEVFPETPWNYALDLNSKNLAKSFTLTKRAGSLPPNPFEVQNVPIQLRTKARRVSAWKSDSLGLVGKLQPSPVKTEEPAETITLVPMGAARLRITSFPVVGHDAESRAWVVAKAPPVTASHCYANDSVEAMVDGIVPKSSNDSAIPRFTWWDHRGSTEWVEYGFTTNRVVSGVEVYWFDDSGKGACRVPKSWKISYRVGEAWKPVESPSAFGTALNQFNKVMFRPVQANGLRLEVELQPNLSGGILEWKVLD